VRSLPTICLALIALHGLETAMRKCIHHGETKQKELSVIFYADDFVVLHKSLDVIQKCKLAAQEWLRGMSLELNPNKTRISHTLNPYEGKVGFDFLGFNIRQYPVEKHHSGRNTRGNLLGFKTLIKPSKSKVAIHVEQLNKTVGAYKHGSQEALIKKLNPIIRGWSKYYSTVTSKRTFANCDYKLFTQLRAWTARRTGRFGSSTFVQYWHYIEDRQTFSTKEGVKLAFHAVTPIVRHVKIRGNKSYFDGDVIYWSTRKGANPELPNRVALLLKKYKGRCPECGLMFVGDDLIEVDHLIPRMDGGTDKFDNLQPLHRHCHDVKTARDATNRKALGQETELESLESCIDKLGEWCW
jgi:RNA-directed DNA polymerase